MQSDGHGSSSLRCLFAKSCQWHEMDVVQRRHAAIRSIREEFVFWVGSCLLRQHNGIKLGPMESQKTFLANRFAWFASCQKAWAQYTSSEPQSACGSDYVNNLVCARLHGNWRITVFLSNKRFADLRFAWSLAPTLTRCDHMLGHVCPFSVHPNAQFNLIY